MDGQIRLRTRAHEQPCCDPAPSQPLRTPAAPHAPGTALANLRRAILDCAAYATLEAPTDRDDRLRSFAARLSATMEAIGEPDLDRALWNLLEEKPPLPAASDVARWTAMKRDAVAIASDN